MVPSKLSSRGPAYWQAHRRYKSVNRETVRGPDSQRHWSGEIPELCSPCLLGFFPQIFLQLPWVGENMPEWLMSRLGRTADGDAGAERSNGSC